MKYPFTQRRGDRACPVGDLEFAVDPADMCLDGLFADGQLGRDRAVRTAGHHEREDLALPLGQPEVRPGPELAPLQPRRGMCHPRGQRRVDERLALLYADEILDKLRAAYAFEQESRGAKAKRLV